MSGLLALLDDVAVIARMAAASVDDIATQTAKAGTKLAGIVIDDAAVTPRYVHGLSPARELPMIWKIARGSIFNKLVLLLPAALLLSAFAPWLISPLLLIGGSYLCYEGAEKVAGWLGYGHHDAHAEEIDPADPRLEETRVKGAIKTDFILSAEIMAIALSTLPEGHGILWQGVVLALVAVLVTVMVYGGVALIVKADDLGLWLNRSARSSAMRAFGAGIVRVMPAFLNLLSVVGTLAMLWVGGSIVLHSLDVMGWDAPYGAVHGLAVWLASGFGAGLAGVVEWLVTAICDGILGLLWGLALIPLAQHVLNPVIAAAKGLRG